MLQLMILGFLADAPSSGYDLRRRINELHGYAKPVSEGSLYPAIDVCVRHGYVTKELGTGRTGAKRMTLAITDAGRERLHVLLRDAHGVDVTSLPRFLVLLAFLHLLPIDEAREVLRRRHAFLDQPASFFYEQGRPLRRNEITDPFRRGMLTIAAAASRAERQWLEETLEATA